jgi:hypothetical protein
MIRAFLEVSGLDTASSCLDARFRFLELTHLFPAIVAHDPRLFSLVPLAVETTNVDESEGVGNNRRDGFDSGHRIVDTDLANVLEQHCP